MTKARARPLKAPAPRQEFEISSLAADTRAILIGRGWECLGRWEWRVARRLGSRGPAPEHQVKCFIDLSRPTPERIPGRDAPTHWAPIAPIEVEGLTDPEVARRFVNIRAHPSPAHVVLDDTSSAPDTAWRWAYALPGAISRPEAEHRLLRALKTSRTPGIVRDRDQGFRSNWPVAQVVAGWGDYAPPITVREFNPTRRDLDDWWRALSWFAALYPVADRTADWAPGRMNVAQSIVLWRSFDPEYSWRQIGDRLNRSNEWARRQYNTTIDQVWHAANQVAD